MKFTVALRIAPEGGFTAQCVEIPGAVSEGDTRRETLDGIAEAIALILDVRRAKAKDPTTTIETVDVHVVA